MSTSKFIICWMIGYTLGILFVVAVFEVKDRIDEYYDNKRWEAECKWRAKHPLILPSMAWSSSYKLHYTTKK